MSMKKIHLDRRFADRRFSLKCISAAVALACVVALSGPAFAQSSDIAPPPSNAIPLPEPFANAGKPLVIPPDDFAPDNAKKIEVLYDLDALPAPVKRMRELIMEAAKSGDLENLRVLLGSGENRTEISYGDVNSDPIEVLHSQSGDTEGHEILAILTEVLEAGFVHLDAGTERELYVWPYFYAMQLEKLTPVQRVELFKLVTAGDYEEMVSFGAYIFFRVGITPDGRWIFFIAGD